MLDWIEIWRIWRPSQHLRLVVLLKHEIQMECVEEITHTENCLRNHRAAKNKKTERKMDTQTSGSQERRGQTLQRRDSMKRIRPSFSCDPDEPVTFDSDVKTEERCSHQTLHQ